LSDQTAQPFFSICVPQYNRTSFLLVALESVLAQSFRDFEICIADDCSTDCRHSEIEALLAQSGVRYTYRKNQKNLRYDGNLRAAIGYSSGRYCFLLGNDDALPKPDVLANLARLINSQAQAPAVLISNFTEADGQIVRRIAADLVLPGTPENAVAIWRDFSFVSGIVLDGPQARAEATDRFDGSEYYQLYLGCRLIARGGSYLGTTQITIAKDIQIAGESVDSFRDRKREVISPWVPRKTTLGYLVPLVCDAIAPHTVPSSRRAIFTGCLQQFYIFTMPYWLVQYRQVQSWSYSSAVALGLRTPVLTKTLNLDLLRRAWLMEQWLSMTVAALLVPIGLFARLRPFLHGIGKSFRRGRVSG